MSLKEQQGVSISLGLPALDEAEKVGNVIQTIKKALMLILEAYQAMWLKFEP